MSSPRFVLVDHGAVTRAIGKMRLLVVDVLNLDEDEGFAAERHAVVGPATRPVV